MEHLSTVGPLLQLSYAHVVYLCRCQYQNFMGVFSTSFFLFFFFSESLNLDPVCECLYPTSTSSKDPDIYMGESCLGYILKSILLYFSEMLPGSQILIHVSRQPGFEYKSIGCPSPLPIPHSFLFFVSIA